MFGDEGWDFKRKKGDIQEDSPVFQGYNILYPNQFPDKRPLLVDEHIGAVTWLVAKGSEYTG